MLKVGDKIRLIEAIDGFNRVGDEFNVISIGENIKIKCEYGIGILDREVLNKHFEVVDEYRKDVYSCI